MEVAQLDNFLIYWDTGRGRRYSKDLQGSVMIANLSKSCFSFYVKLISWPDLVGMALILTPLWVCVDAKTDLTNFAFLNKMIKSLVPPKMPGVPPKPAIFHSNTSQSCSFVPYGHEKILVLYYCSTLLLVRS